MRNATASIDLAALKHNLAIVKELAPRSRIACAVKANGYGHGIRRVAGALESADAFAVACLEEAVDLRDAGFEQPIFLLEGFFATDELQLIAALKLQPVLHHQWQIDALEKADSRLRLEVWLKIDTGMHRLGFQPDQVPAAYQRLIDCPVVTGRPRLLTHFACADDRANPMTSTQITRFDQVAKPYPVDCSLANSAGLISRPESHRSWVRPGIMLYGSSPMVDESAESLGLRPVMTLSTTLIAINEYQEGETIGYGAGWRCRQKCRIGVAAIGYGDGYPRHATPGTPVLVNAKRRHLAGRVSMDMISIDLGQSDEFAIGDSVVLWGDGLDVDEVARSASTISYELFCGVSSRVKSQPI